MTPPTPVAAAYRRCLDKAIELTREALEGPRAMTCFPPPPGKPFAYGDLVPLGFLLMALEACAADVPEKLVRGLEGVLLSRRRKQLWAYHSGTLITSTDSALVLLGLDRPESAKALEMFSDGEGGYLPQLWADEPQPDRMKATPAREHWCRSCYATTCLVRHHQRRSGVRVGAELEGLAAGFDRRSGLYFANPYLVDWALALALQGDEEASDLRARLVAELLSARGDDGLFGCFDPGLSTAWAILALAALGAFGPELRGSQEALAGLVLGGAAARKGVPFYSSQRLNTAGVAAGLAAVSALLASDRHLVRVGSQTHCVSYYEDTHRIITTAVTLMALAHAPSRSASPIERAAAAHPRYRCATHAEYVAGFALPPYVEDLGA